jgi:ferredoxin-NADP reductase
LKTLKKKTLKTCPRPPLPQRYDEYDVLVCVAGGIGVTPMASILGHLAHQVSMDAWGHGC